MILRKYIPFHFSIKTSTVRVLLAGLLLMSGNTSTLSAQELNKEMVGKQTKFIEALQLNAIGRYDKGVEILNDLYKEDRTDPQVCFELAKTYQQLEDAELTKKYIQNAIKLDEKNVWYKRFYAEYLELQNLPNAAAGVYQEVIDLEPDNLDNYRNLGLLHEELKNYDKAVQVYRQWQQRAGKTNEVLLAQYNVFMRQQNYDEAITMINDLVDRKPTHEPYLVMLADAYNANQQRDEAKSIYQRILEINPSSTPANLALLGDEKGASNDVSYIRLLEPIISDPSIQVDAKIKELVPYINRLAQGSDDSFKAPLLEVGQLLAQTHPKEFKAQAAYGDILYHAGQLDKSKTSYKKAISLDDGSFVVWEQYLHLLDELEDPVLYDEAELALDIFPNQAMIYYYYGLGAGLKADYAEGMSILDEGMMVTGGNSSLKANLMAAKATVLLLSNKSEEAKTVLENALQLDPNNIYVIAVMGDYHAQKMEMNKAKTYWQKSLSGGNTSLKLKQKVEGIQ